MKKIFFTACIAVLAIGCSKTEVNYGPDQQIAFAPVVRNVTKAAVESGAPASNLIVSANAGEEGTTSSTACSESYFVNKTFTPDGSVFTATGCYWPNVKVLSFAGVTESAGVSEVEIDVDANTISLDFAQPEFTVANNDLMWFPATAPTGKTNNNINVDLYHALSWLQFNFKGDAVSGASESTAWKILKIDILSLSEEETATINDDEVEWTEDCTTAAGTKKSYNVYTGTITNNYNTSVGLKLQNCSQGASGQAVTTASNNVLVIPQTPCEVSVTYQYAIDGNSITEVATAELNYNGSNKWVAGTKYVYNVTIGATPIKIQPSAGTWTPGTGTLDKTM